MEQVYVASIHPLSDGKLIISGRFRFPGVENEKRTARIDASGDLDPFYSATALGGGTLKPWDNDLVYVGTAQTVRRLLPNGNQDLSFIEMNLGRYFLSLQGGDYHVYPDGRVLMSGAHVLEDSIRAFEGLYSLIWFSNTGYLDTTRTHRLCNGVIYAIEEQPDGKFLCTGTMTTYEGEPVNTVFRVEADGTLDPTFVAPLQWYGEARDYHTLPDGRILVAGPLKLQGSDQVQGLIRLHSDGSLDESFNLLEFYASFNGSGIPVVGSIYELSSDRFIVTGVFDRINGIDRGGIAMIDSSGNLVDDIFDGMGCGAYEYVTMSGSTTYKSIAGIVPSNDGGYFIYGAYHGYDDGSTNDTTQRFVSKLYGLDVGVPPLSSGEGPEVRVYPNPCTTQAAVRWPSGTPVEEFTLTDASGRIVRQWKPSTRTAAQHTFSVDGLSSGMYTLQVRVKDGIGSGRILLIRQ